MLMSTTGDLGPIPPSGLGIDPLDISFWIGLVAPFIVALFLQFNLSRPVKFWLTVVIVVGLTLLAWWATSYPAMWELIATQFAVIFAVSQIVFNALKPTGLLDFLEFKTSYEPKHSNK